MRTPWHIPSSEGPVFWFSRSYRVCLLSICACLLLLSADLFAFTPAGTRIQNQASGSFTWQGRSYSVTSNMVYNRVAPIHHLEIIPDGTVVNPGVSALGSPGTTVYLPFVLINHGNIIDDFDLRAIFLEAESDFDPFIRRLLRDVDGDGRLAPGERDLNANVLRNVAPDGVEHFFLLVEIPTTARAGDQVFFDIQGNSRSDTSVRDMNNVARIQVVDDGFLSLRKAAEPSRVVAGEVVNYQFEIINPSGRPIHGTDVVVDGIARYGVLLTDPIPEWDSDGTFYVPGSIIGQPQGLALLSTDGGNTWRSTTSIGDEPPAEEVTHVGYLWEQNFLASQSGRFEFSVQVNPLRRSGRIANRGVLSFADRHGNTLTDESSNLVFVTVSAVSEGVFLGPFGDPRAQGPTNTNDDFSRDPGVNPRADQPFQVAGNTISFMNSVENASPERRTFNLSVDDRELSQMRDVIVPLAEHFQLPSSTIPEGWTIQLLQADGVSTLFDTNGDGTPDTGPMDPGEVRHFILRVTIPPGWQDPHDHQDEVWQAVIRASAVDDPGVFNLTVNQVPRVRGLFQFWDTFEKIQDAPEILTPGDEITYTNRFGHSGDMIVTNAVIVDTLSDSLTNISNVTNGTIQNLRGPEQIQVEGQYHPENHEIVWVVPQVPPDFLGEISFTAEVAEHVRDGSEIINTFTITSDESQSVRASNDVITVVAGNAVLDLQKESNRQDAELGDPVQYRIQLNNNGPVDRLSEVELLDVLPRGFRYIRGSARVNGHPLEPDISEDGQRLHWELDDLPINSGHSITYAALVTADAMEGLGVNTAVATVTFPQGTRFSTDTSHRIRLREGVFENRSLILGRVFVDINDNRIHDYGEPGIEGVRLYLDDGTSVRTDRNGMYHIEGVHAGHRVIRLDETTLSDGYQLAAIDSANAGNPASRFLDLRWGTPQRANFRIVPAPGFDHQPGEHEAGDAKSRVSLSAWNPHAGKVVIETDRDARITSWYEPTSRTLHLSYHDAVIDEELSKDLFEDPLSLFESLDVLEDKKNSKVVVRLRLHENWQELGDEQWSISSRRVEVNAEPAEPGAQPSPGDAQVDAEAEQKVETEPEPAAASRTQTGPIIEYPADGDAFIARSRIAVGVTAHLAAEFELRLNGEVVSQDAIGLRSYRVRERRTFLEYVGLPLEQGLNVIEWENRMAGSEPEIATIQVFRAAAPESVEINHFPQQLLADGRTEAEVQIRLLDSNGIATGEASVISVRIDGGEIISDDFRPNEPGHQVQIRNGVARIRLAPVERASVVNLTVEAGRMRSQHPLAFQPHLRDWIVVGSADGTASFNRKREQDSLESFSDRDRSGRVAAFIKGQLPHDTLLTASYDSARRWEDNDLFRQYEPERYYPVFGDGSDPVYEAASRDKLFVRLEREQSHVMYGDIWTDMRSAELSAYNRSLTGAKADIRTNWIDFQGFAAEDDQRQIRFEVQGQGISGYYNLPNSNILINSDEILLQVRDRDRPELVISEERLSRHSDYSIDYYLGRVLFKRPVPSTDENFNPTVLVFRYEVENDRQGEFLSYGGRVGVHDPNRRVSVGVTQVIEENEDIDHRLQGVDGRIELGHGMHLEAEYARTRDAENFEDDASRFEFHGTWSQLDLRLYYQDVGEFFNNPNTRGNLGGRETYGVDALSRAGEDWEFRSQAYRQSIRTFESTEDVFVQDIIYKTRRADYLLGGGYVQETAAVRGDPDAEPEQRENPFLKAGIGVRLSERIRSQLLHQQSLSSDVTRDQSTRTSADILYQMFDHTALSMTLERRKMLDGYQESLLVGSEHRYNEWLTGSHKYAMDGHTSGRRGRAVNGLQADYPVNDQLSLLASLEVSTLLNESVDSSDLSRGDDFWATALGFRYTQANAYTLNGRVEVRQDDRQNDYFKELGGTRRFGRDHTFFARNRLHYSDLKDQDSDRWRVQFLTGWAYRPVLFDRMHYITDFRVEYEQGGGTSGFGKLNRVIWSNDLNYQWTYRLHSEWKYAVKWTEANFADGNFTSDLIANRWRYDLHERWFSAAGVRVLRDHRVSTAKVGYGVELGYRPVDDFIIAVGYNFEGFRDRDFSRGDHWEKGPYISFRFKFDESILGVLSRLERSPQ